MILYFTHRVFAEVQKTSLTSQSYNHIFPESHIGAQMKKFTEVMKALSDPNRVRIMKMLQHRSMCVCELQEGLGISQPTVSKHLKILEGAGLVGFKKDGLWVDYFLSDGSESPYAGVLLGNLRHWLEDDEAVSQLINKLPSIRREDICKK
jgi:ArsR family transcriptional regulator, arsenate/arsenite/antimonite-responsive transcriptional repressor